jgi:hypothetical protein
VYLRPFFSFFGSKFLACRKRVYPTPQYDLIIEPFAGAAGYSVNNFQRKIWLFEIDPKIFGVWSYLIGARASEIRRLPERVESVYDIKGPQEARWLVGFWLARGIATPRITMSPWARNRKLGQNFYWGKYVRGMIARQIKHIRHWKVFNKSYEQIQYYKPATWFIDPPYQNKAGRCYRFNKIDYDWLSSWCIIRQGQVMVCENKGADWLPFVPIKEINKTVKKGGRSGKSKEVMWCHTDRWAGFLNIWRIANANGKRCIQQD